MRVAVDVPSFIDDSTSVTKNNIYIGQKNVRVANNLLGHAINIRKAGVEPVFIFDAQVPSSAGTVEETGTETGDGDEKIDHQRIANLTKERLEKEGVPFCDAPGKAVAECADRNSKNGVDAVMSDNTDVFLFGGRRVLHHEKTLEGVVMVMELKEEHLRLAMPNIFSLQNCFITVNILAKGVESCGPAIACKIGASSYGSELAAIVHRRLWGEIEDWKRRLGQHLKAEHPNVASSLSDKKLILDHAAIGLYMEEGMRRDQGKTGQKRQPSDQVRPVRDTTSASPINSAKPAHQVKPGNSANQNKSVGLGKAKPAKTVSPGNSKGKKRKGSQDENQKSTPMDKFFPTVLGETSANSANLAKSTNTANSSSVPKSTLPEPVKSAKSDYAKWLVDNTDLERPRKRRSKTSSQ